MGFPLLSLIPKIIKTAGSILGVDSVGDVVEALQNNKLTPEQRVQLELATREYEKEMRQYDIEELKTVMSEQLAMITSSDKYVARARPTMIYVATLVTTFLAVVVGITVLHSIPIDWGAVGAVTSLLAPLWGVSGYYVGKRTQEKLNGGNGA